MGVHVSVRLLWHDNGWNGAICRNPAGNVWCEGHEHVRTHKDVADEEANAGKSLTESSVPAGCEISAQAFSTRRNQIRIWPPDWMEAQGIKSIDFSVDKYSTGLWPYEEMWGPDGQHKPNDERRATVEAFFDEIEPLKSLVFFYVDERNPLFVEDGERSPHRVLVGLARVKSIEDIAEWNEATYWGEVNMVWSVPFQHTYPKDGIRLPVQAIEATVGDLEERAQYLVPLDGGLRTDFRYGSARITNDRAVAVVERAIGALSRLRDSGKVEISVEAELDWLNGVLLEVWGERGPYPGIAPILAVLDCNRAIEIQSRAIPALVSEGSAPAAVIFEALEGAIDPVLSSYADDLQEAGEEWDYLDDDEKTMLRRLATIELRTDEVRSLLSAESRTRHGLPAGAEAISNNPYLLCERFTPKKDHEPISFITVDHGLVPHESMKPLDTKPIAKKDPRRLRALLTEVLEKAADEGHTFIRAEDALAGVGRRAPDDRPCDVPLDRLRHAKVAPVLDETIEQFEIDEVPYLALRSIAEAEVTLENTFDELVARPLEESEPIDWQHLADKLAGDEDNPAEPVKLSEEQTAALDRSFRSPLSVLTGAAGTGKSTLLAPLVAAIEEREGKVPIRVLTPTGKAADRLRDLGVQAMTIHRALASAEWYDWELGVWTDTGEPIEAQTVVIDESSMVDLELCAALFRAVDWHSVRRLVLVGDHYQVPPIGPGRPFFDLIGRMGEADQGDANDPYRNRLSELTDNYRVARGSNAIAFANGFARQAEPDEPLLWGSLGKQQDLGDLRIRFWKDPEHLHELLTAEIETLVHQACTDADHDPDKWGFDFTIGHGDSPFDVSLWQVIAPMRDAPHGTRKLNAVVQDKWHSWSKRPRRAPSGAYIRWPVKIGDEQITARDKVMQISNEQLPYWVPGEKGPKPKKKPRAAIFNGQMGTVQGEWPRANQKYRGPNEKGAPSSISIEFEGHPNMRFDYRKNGWLSANKHLELAYAITVHKAQGSQFRHVFFVVPKAAADFFGRELTYTGLTRAQDTLTLFVEGDLGPLLALRKRSAAKTPQRNSRLFSAQVGNLPFRPGSRVFGTTRGERVASKSEVIIADLLHRYELEGHLTYSYEEELPAPGGAEWDIRLPDFTVRVGGKTFYWEHCGRMDHPAYRKKWEDVRLPWYKKHGFESKLIVTVDGEADPIDSGKLESEIVKDRILAA